MAFEGSPSPRRLANSTRLEAAAAQRRATRSPSKNDAPTDDRTFRSSPNAQNLHHDPFRCPSNSANTCSHGRILPAGNRKSHLVFHDRPFARRRCPRGLVVTIVEPAGASVSSHTCRGSARSPVVHEDPDVMCITDRAQCLVTLLVTIAETSSVMRMNSGATRC